MVRCLASRPTTIPAAFIQGAFNGPEPTRTGAAPIPHLAAAFKAKVADLCLGGGFSARAMVPIGGDICALLLSQQNSGFIAVKRTWSAPYLHDAVPVVARGDLKQG